MTESVTELVKLYNPGLDPGSMKRIHTQKWIPAFAGMTYEVRLLSVDIL